MALLSGSKIGPYEILAPLGAGGMGEVYRARDPKLGRDVAIKVLPSELADNPDALSRFEREARAVAQLSHPNILAIHDFGRQGETAYAVMELLEGETLRTRLTHGALPARKAVELAVQMAEGLAAAHEKGIVHRDLKPENVFVTNEGRAKLLDFGLAKSLGSAGDEDADQLTASKHTGPGTVMGTAGYMSPEQVRGTVVDHRSDIFSFGVVLYEMLSGQRAFVRETAAESMTAILKEDPPEIATSGSGPSPALQRIVQHCLEKKPGERFQSARDIAFNLQAVSGPAVTSEPSIAVARRGARLWLTVIAVAVVLGIANLALYRKIERASLRAAAEISYRQITFQRGTIQSARFAPDGETVVYGAAWEGRPVEPFLTRLGGPESRRIGVPGADILAISSSGEMAISLDRHDLGGWRNAGTLARVALAGGAPRPVLEDVQWADWSPDGSALAVVRDVGGKCQLEYPIGTVLYTTSGWISHARVSPRGDFVAFLDHPIQGDDRGSVAIVDHSGKKRKLCGEWASEQGLAWSPTGDEVWFTGIALGADRALHAVTLKGVERTLANVPGDLLLHDVSRTGRILLGREGHRVAILSIAPGAQKERDVSALDWSIATDLSADGRSILIGEEGAGSGPNNSVYLRRTDVEAPAVLLGEGSPMALSPDGKWVLCFLPSRRNQLMLLPTGTGEVRRLPESGLEYQRSGTFLPDGKRVVCAASEPGHAVRMYVQGLDGGKPRAITPEGVSIPLGFHPVSPDGRLIAAIGTDGEVRLYPVEGGNPSPVPGIEAGEVPIRFSADSRSLYVFRRGQIPARVFRFDLQTGRRELLREITPGDPAGSSPIQRILMTSDGQSFAYSASRNLSELYVAEGLK